MPTPELRASFVRDRSGVYEDILDLFAELDAREASAGWAREAFDYSERGRARAFLDLLTESRTTGLTQAAPLGAAAAQRLAGDSAVLEFALGKRVSLLWVITRSEFRMFRLPARSAIEREVQAFRDLLSRPPAANTAAESWREPAQRLMALLFGAADRDLEGTREWIVVPDGVLHYLPFETLVSAGGRVAVEEHTVVYAASVSAYARLPQAPGHPQKELLAYGDPDFGESKDGWVSEVRGVYAAAGIRLDPLPNTRREVTAIGGLFEPWQRTLRLGGEATKVSLLREDLRAYRRIHFATHAIIDERVPARSGLVLSLPRGAEEEGVLRMDEITKLHLNTEVVVLSACRTGLGSFLRGEGLIGLTRAFQYAGAERVVVSLWPVADSAAADLMQDFYAQMRSGGVAESLEQAKRKMLSSGGLYGHPYYWAPFVVAGRR